MTIGPKSYHALALGLAFAAGVSMAPASANAGFFDQLFGGGAPQPSQPSYSDPVPQQMAPFIRTPAAPRHIKKKIALRDATPVRQKTTDLWHDKTLRPGDAVVMRDGLHIYNGPEAGRHSSDQFVPMDDADHVTTTQRAALVAMDTTRFNPLKADRGSDVLASGRSAAVGAPISPGFRITDARGASVRYVGP